MEIWDGGRDTDKFASPDATDWANIVQEIINIQKVIMGNNNIYSNIAAENILAGQPLILESNSRIQLADINNDPKVIGLSIADCLINENCTYISQGRLSLSDWFNIVNSVKLIPGAYYYLSGKGKLTSTVPNSLIMIQIGQAQNEMTLNIDIKIPIYFS